VSPLRIACLLLAVLLLPGCAEFPYAGARAGGSFQGDDYVVARGDTLYSIAWRSDLDFRDVARWNDIDPPYTIYPGERLRLAPPRSSSGGGHAPRTTAHASPTPARQATSAPSGEDQDREVSDAALHWRWPTSGRVMRRFSRQRMGKHGIDLGGEIGQPVRAAAGGRVVYSGDGLRGYGNLIIVKHNSRYLTAYGYNEKLLVEEGAKVAPGQMIARMGRGPDSKPALHFEVRRDGKPVDPLKILPER